MKLVVVTIGRSGSSELIKKISKYNINISKLDNHLYPNKLIKKYGKNIKVIFITRNIKDIIKSILQREKDYGLKWIKKHYINLNGNFKDYNKIFKKDTLNFEKLYDSYMNQKIFDVLFIKYEYLYFNNQDTIDAIREFTNIKSFNITNNPNNKWKGNYSSNKKITLSWDKSLQNKIDSYKFYKLNKKIKIAHIINPFKCTKNNSSYIYYAQPITFQSMRNAQLEAHKVDIDIKLYAINYQEDDEIVPQYFIKLPHLKKSTKTEFPKISKNKKLPIIQEIFNSILKNSDADYIIFTNIDIGVQKNFYKKIYYKIKNGQKAFIINRRNNIPKFKNNHRLTKNNLNLIYKEKGKIHPGKDCFIINRNILKKIDMCLMFTGYPPWGNVLFETLIKLYKKTKIFKNKYWTFHIGDDKLRIAGKQDKLWKKNINISKNII